MVRLRPAPSLISLLLVSGLVCLTLISPTTAASPTAPLGGPDVPDEDERTIVDNSMSRGFQRVRGRPEAAALRKLELDDAIRAKAEEIIRDRSTALVVMLIDEVDTLREITDLNEAGERLEARELLYEMQERFEASDGGTPGRDPLLEPLCAVLSEPDATELRRMVNDYWEAWIRWALRDRLAREAAERAEEMDADDDSMMAAPGMNGPDADLPPIDPGARERTQRRLSAQTFQDETRAAYERSLKRYHDALQGIYAAVEPTPEQREAIRTIVIDHIKATHLEPTPDERRQTYQRIYDLLDDRQQRAMFDYLLRVVVPED